MNDRFILQADTLVLSQSDKPWILSKYEQGMYMYFWKIESLKEDIKNGSFSDKDLIPYLVLYVGFYAVSMEILGYLPYEDINIWTYMGSLVNILLPVAGTLYAYKMNGGSNGTNFCSKYFSVGFVVSIRFMIYFMPVLIFMFIYWEFAYGEQEETQISAVEMVLFFSWYVFLYLNIAKHIGDTAREKK